MCIFASYNIENTSFKGHVGEIIWDMKTHLWSKLKSLGERARVSGKRKERGIDFVLSDRFMTNNVQVMSYSKFTYIPFPS